MTSIEFLEREYNARASIPEHPQIFARWAEQGALVRRRHAALIDMPYGEDPGMRVDVFPTRQRTAPLLVFIHGGYWRSLDKFDFSWIAPPFLDRGVAVALLNYGLAPGVGIEQMVRQQLEALRWLFARADEIGFDRDRIVVCGHSAGAHLTAMLMAALWPAFDPRLPSDLVKGGVAVSGLFDLEPLVALPFINGDLNLDVAGARRLSPLHLPAATAAPLVTAVGALESGEFKHQTQRLRAAWPDNVREHIEVTGAHHLTVVDQLADPASDLFRAALGLLQAG